MTRRILVAALLTLGIGSGYWAYIAWPEWFGTEIHVDAILGLRAPRATRAALDWPSARLQLTIPGAAPDDSPVPYIAVRQIGPVWPGLADPLRAARLMHGRMLYLQVESRQSVEGARPLAQPVSVSTTPIAGAINLHVRVTWAQPSGRVHVALGPPEFLVPPTLAPDAMTSAILRVLPSGRFALIGLVAR